MAYFEDLASRYIEAFNEIDPAQRRRMIDQLYTADAHYTDPQVALRGPDEIAAFIAQTQAQFPGYAFSLGGAIDAHHDQARFNWHATPPGASEPAYADGPVTVAAPADGFPVSAATAAPPSGGDP